MDKENPYLQWLKSQKKLSDNTVYLYWRYYQRFEEHPFSQEGINKFFATKKINNSISRAFMKSLLEFLKMEDQFELPPKPTGKKKRKLVRDLSQSQIKKIRDHAYNKSKILGFMFDFIYYGALRRSEVCKIKVCSFNWDLWFQDPIKHCELKLEQAKGNKDRVVLIPAHVVKSFLDFYLDVMHIKPHDLGDLIQTLDNTIKPVFTQKNGSALSGWKVWKIIKTLSHEALNTEIRPHELRHARATELEEKGMSIRTIQHYLGHSSPQITEVYLHTSEKHSLSKIKEGLVGE